MYLLLYWISNWIHVPITLYHIHIMSYHITSCTLAIILFPFTFFHNKVCVSCSHALLQLFRPEDLMPRGVLAMFVQRSACPHSACLTRAVWQLKPRCSQVKFDRWRWDDVLVIYWLSGLLDCWDLQAVAPGGSLRCSVDSKVVEWRCFAASFQMISCQRPATRRKKRRWKRHRLPGDGLRKEIFTIESKEHWDNDQQQW